MTRLLIGYDGSDAARAAIRFAGGLFGAADAVVAHVHPPPPPMESGALARAALPQAMITEGLARLRADTEAAAGTMADEGVQLARAAGLRAEPSVRFAVTPWRELRQLAASVDADAIVCGATGEGRVGRVLLGSTASSLLHQADRPLLVVPDDAPVGDGPVVAGYDDSDGARTALRFAADHLRDRRVLVAHAWRSPVRHSIRGQVLAGSGVEMLEDYARSIDSIWDEVATEVAHQGTAFAQELGLDARPLAPESGRGAWRALLHAAEQHQATVILVGSRGRGAAASTVLGSVASGLVHASTLAVMVVPRAAA
jgi:nucleotide-binding universal stress UspA family protein